MVKIHDVHPAARAHCLTRRSALKGAAAIGAGFVSGGVSGQPAFAAAQAALGPSPEGLLRAELQRLSDLYSPALFVLVKHQESEQSDRVDIRALVRLTWSAGMQQVWMTGQGADGFEAVADIVGRLVVAFPGLVERPVQSDEQLS